MMVMACYGMLWHAGLGCKVPGGDGSERGAGGAKHCRFMCQTCFAYVSYPFVPKFVSIAQETGIKGELDGALAETPKESPPFCATVRHQRSTKESSACATRTTFASDRMISSSQWKSRCHDGPMMPRFRKGKQDAKTDKHENSTITFFSFFSFFVAIRQNMATHYIEIWFHHKSHGDSRHSKHSKRTLNISRVWKSHILHFVQGDNWVDLYRSERVERCAMDEWGTRLSGRTHKMSAVKMHKMPPLLRHVTTSLGLHFTKAEIKELLADSTASSLDGKVRMMFVFCLSQSNFSIFFTWHVLFRSRKCFCICFFLRNVTQPYVQQHGTAEGQLELPLQVPSNQWKVIEKALHGSMIEGTALPNSRGGLNRLEPD